MTLISSLDGDVSRDLSGKAWTVGLNGVPGAPSVSQVNPDQERPPEIDEPPADVLAGLALMDTWALTAEAADAIEVWVHEELWRSRTSAASYEVLVRLLREEGSCLPLSRLGDEVGLTSGGVTKVVDRLEQRGLAARRHSAADRRVIYAELSDHGVRFAEELQRAMGEVLQRAIGDVLSNDEIALLSKLLRRLRNASAPSILHVIRPRSVVN